MSSATKSANVANGADTAFANISASQQEVMESFMEVSQAIFNGLVAYNKELTNFVAGRVVTDLDLQQRLLECRSVEDVVAIQSEFLETTVSQYSGEAQKLATIGADVVKEDLEAISRHMKPSPSPRKAARKQSA